MEVENTDKEKIESMCDLLEEVVRVYISHYKPGVMAIAFAYTLVSIGVASNIPLWAMKEMVDRIIYGAYDLAARGEKEDDN